MHGKVVLITGATSGIGKAAAMGLARMGATTVVGARNVEKGRQTIAEIQAITGSPNVEMLVGIFLHWPKCTAWQRSSKGDSLGWMYW
jgi:NAD(P)-dependent dehydrogenase (short-subunit alcohol dehydrogenase family)